MKITRFINNNTIRIIVTIVSFSLHIFRLDERHAIFQEYTYKYLNYKFRASLIALLHH